MTNRALLGGLGSSSLGLYIYLSIYLSVCLSVCLSIYLSIYLPLSLALSMYMHTCMHACTYVCMCVISVSREIELACFAFTAGEVRMIPWIHSMSGSLDP